METRLQLIEDNFESQQSGKSDLLIHIGRHNISYAIVDQGREQLKALVEYDATLDDLASIVAADKCLRYFYRKVKIAFDTFKFTFIPRDLYDVSEIHNYAKFITTGSSEDILVGDIRSCKIKSVTAISTEMRHTIASQFPQALFYQQASAIIEGAFNTAAAHTKQQLYIHIQPERLDMALIKDRGLLFYNLFESTTPDELNYFLLLIITQFNLNADNTDVVIAGKIETGDNSYQRIAKYFNHITDANPCAFVQCSEKFNTVNLHKYFPLLALNLCE